LRAAAVTDPADAGTAFVWMRDRVAIDGATADGYALTAADEGRQITVQVTATAAGFTEGRAVSSAVVPTAAVTDPGSGGGSGTPGAGAGSGSGGSGAGGGAGSPAGSANNAAGSSTANGRDLATTGQNTEGVAGLAVGALLLLLLGAGAVVLRRRSRA
ncbi:LPXTG cell wall anchor domain-containing protein, partial [Microbacterium sp. Leaf203]|uniref:LPXTG cell wall anchor domain-containing protein n=1 Tax=Microbacterium sp. Leaf203 TaxID=1735677 RepID=UPI001910EB3D